MQHLLDFANAVGHAGRIGNVFGPEGHRHSAKGELIKAQLPAIPLAVFVAHPSFSPCPGTGRVGELRRTGRPHSGDRRSDGSKDSDLGRLRHPAWVGRIAADPGGRGRGGQQNNGRVAGWTRHAQAIWKGSKPMTKPINALPTDSQPEKFATAYAELQRIAAELKQSPNKIPDRRRTRAAREARQRPGAVLPRADRHREGADRGAAVRRRSGLTPPAVGPGRASSSRDYKLASSSAPPKTLHGVVTRR